MKGSTVPYFPAHSTPATAASAEPMAKAATITWLMLMPINRAARRFSDAARMAMPTRFLRTKTLRQNHESDGKDEADYVEPAERDAADFVELG